MFHTVRVTLAATMRRGPRPSVGEPADDEEQRHHLEHPGQHLEVGVELEQIGAGELPASIAEHRHRPVAEHDDADRHDPDQIDVTVP